MKVTIIGREQFKRDWLPHVNSLQNTAFISILEPEDTEPFAEDEKNYMSVHFYDLEEDIDNGAGHLYKAITEEQAKRIYNFIKENSDKEHFVIHCHAGIARSSSVGSFIHEYFGGAYKDLLKQHPHILPNGRALKLLRMYERIEHHNYNNTEIKF